MTPQIKESDWRRLRRLSPLALDRFCERVLGEIALLASTSNRNHHERYLKIYRLLKKRDRELGDAFDDQRRSNAILKLMTIKSLDLLTDEEYSGFSEETRARVDAWLG